MKTLLALLLLAAAPAANAQSAANIALWNAPQQPFALYGNTFYVGPHGLSSVLITSPQGHILIDGALPESAADIARHIRELGFKVEDIRLILSSHVHRDHAGGLAELQRLSGAKVVASRSNATVLTRTGVSRDDPQFGELRPIPRVSQVQVVEDGETLHVGPLAVTAHLTPGHTPGGTSWTWQSCASGRCLDLVYADSVTAVSARGYRYADHPLLLLGFAKTFAFLDETPCSLLITAHPDASGVLDHAPDGEGNRDGRACKRLAETGRDGLKKRLQTETGKP